VPGDFTGDRKADQVYESDATAIWYTAGQTTPLYTGQPHDIPVAGDYDGDGKWEPAVLRGTTWVSSALADPIVYDPAGMPPGPAATPANGSAPPAILPVPGDYDGTGKTVPAYYDQVDATWWIMGHAGSVQFGIPPAAGGKLDWDVPVPADYDGDGKTDIAVFRPTDGSFHYLSSKTGLEVTIPSPTTAANPGLMPMPGDYDKVGHAEAAVVDLGGDNWYVEGHPSPIATFAGAGSAADLYLPAAADYDGDGKVDPALVDQNTGTWWMSGQPEPAQQPSSNLYAHPAVFPYARLVNIVRLTLYAACLRNPSSYPGRC
jgi:hypothetical protein